MRRLLRSWSVQERLYYRPQRSWGKVMFSQACVILFTEGICLSACWDTPLRTRHPPGPGTPPQDQAHHPRCRACWEIRPTRGRYASYWNAILFPTKFSNWKSLNVGNATEQFICDDGFWLICPELWFISQYEYITFFGVMKQYPYSRWRVYGIQCHYFLSVNDPSFDGIRNIDSFSK